jgi:hypothetical protein
LGAISSQAGEHWQIRCSYLQAGSSVLSKMQDALNSPTLSKLTAKPMDNDE